MSRSLHWTLLLGCGAIVGLYARPAWNSVRLCELPSDCRPTAPWLEALFGGDSSAGPVERMGALEEEGEPPLSIELVADRS